MSIKKQVETNEIPEVETFLEVAQRLESFLTRQAAIMAELRTLGAEYNEALEAAEKAVRLQGVSCGPFKSVGHSYDANVLFENLGKETFMKLGGVIGTKIVPSIDRKLVDKAYGLKQLPSVLYEEAKRPRFRRLRKVELP